jgi:hypothetical protein
MNTYIVKFSTLGLNNPTNGPHTVKFVSANKRVHTWTSLFCFQRTIGAKSIPDLLHAFTEGATRIVSIKLDSSDVLVSS